MTTFLLYPLYQTLRPKMSFLWALFLCFFLAVIVGAQYGKIAMLTPPPSLLSFKLMPAAMAMFLMAASSALLGGLTRKNWLMNFSNTWLLMASGATFGLLIGRSWETHHVLEQGHFGVTNLYEVSLLLLAFIGGIAPFIQANVAEKGRFIGAFLAPLVLAGVGFTLWLASIGKASPEHLVPALKSYWLPFHVIANFVGYGAFVVAAAAGLMHLWRWRQDKCGHKSHLPDQKTCEELGFRSVAVGFPVFTLAILLGSVWAYEAWGGYWSWDPKETWALIVWLVYAGYLHTRMNRKTSDVILAIWLIVGFLVTMFCYLGVNMWLGGMHSYGSLN